MTGTRSLENIANKCALPGKSGDEETDFRLRRWAARAFLWQESGLKRVRTCGRVSIVEDGSVQVRANGQAVGFAGLATCGSVWACPVCNAKIQAVRRLEVGSALAWALDTGGAAFGAYTVRHHKGQPLDGLWRSGSKMWAAVTRDKSVRTIRKDLGHLGYIKSAEVTYGQNGWHPHWHPLHLFDNDVTDGDIQALHDIQQGAWIRAAERLGLDAPREAAQELHRVTGELAHQELSEYMAKGTYRPTHESVGWEMTSTQTKTRTRAKGSQTPWELLQDALEWGSADGFEAWLEWERASKGKRQIQWSRGVRSMVGLDLEVTDEEVAAAEAGSVEDAGFVINDWGPIRRNYRLGPALLSTVGKSGNWDAGRQFCADNGISIRENND